MLQLLRSDEGAEYSAMDASADGATAFLADKDGAVEVVDTRQAADAKPAAVRAFTILVNFSSPFRGSEESCIGSRVQSWFRLRPSGQLECPARWCEQYPASLLQLLLLQR